MPRQQSFADRAAASVVARRRRGRRLLVAAGVVLLLLGVCRANPVGSLVVEDLLDHPVALGLVGYGLAVAGVVHLLEDPVRRLAVGVLLAGVGGTGFGLAGLVLSTQVSPDHTITRVAAPGAAREAVVDDDGRQPTRSAHVVVQDTRWGLRARRHEVACASMPAADRVVRQVTWSGSSLRLELADGTSHHVELAADGSARSPLAVGPACR